MTLSLSSDNRELLVGTNSGKIYRVLTDTLDATLHSESHTAGINDVEFPLNNSELFATVINYYLLINSNDFYHSKEIFILNRLMIREACFCGIVNFIYYIIFTYYDKSLILTQ
jgi:hypothetical protein